MSKFILQSTFFRGGLLALSLFAANCSGRTYNTFFQPFDLVFGSQANSSVNVSLLTATPLTNTRVMLTFNKPVSLASGQLVGNYRITDANGNLLQILAASRDPNNSRVIFVDTIPQAAGTTYTVTASNIVGVDGSSLGSSNSATFTAPTNADQTGPVFSSVSALSTTSIELYFNEAVDASNLGTYVVHTGGSCSATIGATITAARDASNQAKVTLTLTSGALSAGTQYSVRATGVRDIWGNSSSPCSSAFSLIAPTPKVASVTSASPSTVLVTYTEDMDTTGIAGTALTAQGNYTINGCAGGGSLTLGTAGTVVGQRSVLFTGVTQSGTVNQGSCNLSVTVPGGTTCDTTAGLVCSAAGARLTTAGNTGVLSYNPSATNDTNAPSVVGVTTTNSNTVVVTFSENVTGVSSSAPFADFSFSPALNITAVNCVGNVCTLTTADQSTTPYSLSVTNNDGGIQDTATPANTLSSGSTTFTGDGKPYIVAIYPIDTTTVMVQWSEPIGPRSSIDDTTSGDGFDYSLSPLTATDISEVRLFPTGGAAGDYSAYVRISLATAMTSGTTYTLAYSDVAPTGGTDQTGNTPSTTIPGGGTFTGPVAENTKKPYIVSASSTSTTTVIVNFNEPINNANIDPADFTLGGASCPSGNPSSAVQISAGVIQLVVTAGAGGAGTTCTVAVAADQFFDLLGNGNSATTPTVEYNYNGTGAGADAVAPTIASIVSLSNTQIQVFFSEPMQIGADGMDALGRYSSSPALTFSSVGTCATGSTSCIINTSAQTATNYTLSISAGIQDSNNVATTGTISGTFIGTGGSATAPTLYQAVLINSTTVELSFSEQMALTSAQNTANYTVSGGNTVSAAVLQADATKVRLTITPGAYGSSNSYTVTATGVTDTATPANPIGSPNSATFNGSATAPSTASLAAASDTGTVGDNITGAAFPSPGLQFTGTTTANTTVVLYYSPTVSFTDAGDLVTLNSHGLANGTAVTFSTINSTTGVVTNTTYYVINATANTFQLASTPGGAVLPLTTNGTGILRTPIPLATTTSDASGNYTVTVSSGTNIAQGTNQFNVATVGQTGLVSDLSQTFSITYDSVAPGQPTNVTSNLADGTYGIGQVVDIRVTFPEVVIVTGTPQLELSTGTPATTPVNYASGSGTNTLVFNYTVVSGNTNADLNYSSTNALTLNGGTIGDAAGNAAALTLPGLAAAGSLATNKALNINGVVSGTITYDQSGNTAGPFRTGTVTITATYASAPGSTPTIAIDQQGTNDIAATAMTGGPNVFTYTYTVNAAGGTNADGTATITLSTPSVPATPTFIIDTTNPSAPAGITPPAYSNSTTATGVTYTNSGDANFSTHNVRACTSNDCATGCLSASTDAASPVDVSGLSNGTAYYICIQGVDTAGNMSAYVASATTVTVDTTAPSAASGVSVPTYTQATNADVTFTAGTDTNITTSNVRMCTSNDCTTGCVGATTGNSPTNIASLVNGTAYYGCVQSRDLAGNTASWVASAATVTVDTTNPTAPTGVTVPGYSTSTSADITFTAGTDTNITTSNVKMCTSNDCTTGCVGATTGNSPATISGLSNGSSYYGCVQSRDLSGRTSAWVASAAPVVIDTTAPTAASGVTVPTWSTTTSAAISFTAGTDTNITTSNLKMCTGNDCSTGCVGATTGNSGTSVGSLVAGTAYYGCVQSRDLAGNTAAWVASAGTVTVDNTAPSGYSVAIDQSYINNANKAAVSFTFTGAETGTTYNYTFSSSGGGTPVTGTGTISSSGQQISGINLTGLNDGTITLSVTLTDPASNVGTAATHTRTKDVVVPVISATSPSSGAGVASSAVNMTFSEDCGSGSVVWTSTSGTGHPNGPHTRTLTGSELNAGAQTNIAFASNPLVGGSVYTITWNCTDVAGNAATAVTATGVTYSDGPPTIASAVALDTNYNGKIDTYQVTFSKNIDDTTFPGYIANSLGNLTNSVFGGAREWYVAGYTSVRMIHGTAVTFATDTANDSVIYVRFNENVLDCNASTQTGCDTDAKPDLTTTGTPGVTDGVLSLAQVNVATVTEADGAAPVTVRALSLGPTSLDVTFSEPMTATQANVAGNYTLTGGLSVSAASRDGTNFRIVHLTTSSQTGGTSYTLTVNTTLRDLTNINLITSTNPTTGLPANQVQFNGVDRPVVQSITTIDATTLLITINETVTEASATCANQTACASIYSNTALPVLSAVAANSSGVATPGNSRYFRLTVNPMIEGQAYTTTVLQNTMTSVATSQQMGNTNNSATFNGDGKPGANISTGDMTAGCPGNAASRVYVLYDQTVSATATTATNYKITECVTGASCSGGGATGFGVPNSNGASSVTSLGGNKYAVDFSDNFGTDSTVYQLTISGVQDSNGNTIAAPGNLTFQCGDDSTAPVLVGATVVSATAGSTVVLLTFSEAVDSVTANVAGNYKYDTQSYGTNVLSAARQSNNAQVLVTFQPALSNGGHQIRVQNIADIRTPTANVIDSLPTSTTNIQPVIVNAPTGFAGGPVFTDPFADGTPAGQIIIYDDKLVLGWDGNSSQFFEMNKGLTVAQTITLDADGNASAPYTDFSGYGSASSGTLSGLDAISAGCVGGTNSTPSMTGTACTGAPVNGTEYIFAGAFNTSGNYRSVFRTTSKSSAQPRFTFTERGGLDASGNTYRSMTAVLFKNYLFVASPHIGSSAPRTSRVCALPSGSCGNGETSWNTPTAIGGRYFPTIGKQANLPNSTGVSNPKGNAVAIDTMFEYDTDGTGGTSCSGASCPSQLYLANGGRFFGTLAANTARTATTRFDGGVIRSHPNFSTEASPPGCSGASAADCENLRFENVTPSSSDWRDYMSIPLPYLTIAGADWENMLPSNRIIPAMKAIPYMRQAPNGDLYMIRNACATLRMQTVCMVSGSCNGGAGNGLVDADIPNGLTVAQTVNDNFTANFALTANGRRQVCPPGYEVPQLWVLPRSTGASRNGSAQWTLVASRTFTPQTYPNGSALPSRKSTTLSGNTTTCGTAPNNKCERNAHVTLLEFVGNYLYLGFDNQDHGANIWRVDMNSATCTGSASCATSGNYPAESSFAIVNDVLGLDGSATNQRIFSHVTVNDSGKDWLILATRDGTNSMKIYRTSND